MRKLLILTIFLLILMTAPVFAQDDDIQWKLVGGDESSLRAPSTWLDLTTIDDLDAAIENLSDIHPEFVQTVASYYDRAQSGEVDIALADPVSNTMFTNDVTRPPTTIELMQRSIVSIVAQPDDEIFSNEIIMLPEARAMRAHIIRPIDNPDVEAGTLHFFIYGLVNADANFAALFAVDGLQAERMESIIAEMMDNFVMRPLQVVAEAHGDEIRFASERVALTLPNSWRDLADPALDDAETPFDIERARRIIGVGPTAMILYQEDTQHTLQVAVQTTIFAEDALTEDFETVAEAIRAGFADNDLLELDAVSLNEATTAARIAAVLPSESSLPFASGAHEYRLQYMVIHMGREYVFYFSLQNPPDEAQIAEVQRIMESVEILP